MNCSFIIGIFSDQFRRNRDASEKKYYSRKCNDCRVCVCVCVCVGRVSRYDLCCWEPRWKSNPNKKRTYLQLFSNKERIDVFYHMVVQHCSDLIMITFHGSMHILEACANNKVPSMYKIRRISRGSERIRWKFQKRSLPCMLRQSVC